MGSIPAILGISFLRHKSKKSSIHQEQTLNKPIYTENRLIKRTLDKNWWIRKLINKGRLYSNGSFFNTSPTRSTRLLRNKSKMLRRSHISLQRSFFNSSLHKTSYNNTPTLRSTCFFHFKKITNRGPLSSDLLTQHAFDFIPDFWTNENLFKLYTSFTLGTVFKSVNKFNFDFALRVYPSTSLSLPFYLQIWSSKPQFFFGSNSNPTITFKRLPGEVVCQWFFQKNLCSKELIHSLSIRFHNLQYRLYQTVRRQTLLRNRLRELAIKYKAQSQIWLNMYYYPVSSRLLTNLTHREQVPPFATISKYRNTNLFPTPNNFSLNNFFTQTRSTRLLNTPLSLNCDLKTLLNSSQISSFLVKPTIRKRTMVTHLVTRATKRFMRKRLFRPKPMRTFLRTIRHTRRFLTKWRRSNILNELNKKDKKAKDLTYERALFKEVLSTPKGEEGPLLRSLKYTGFETMPFMNQQLGNKIFLIKRKMRNSLFKSRLPRGKIRRYEVRKLLQKYSFWALQIEQFRLLAKFLNEGVFERDYGTFTSEETQKRYRYAMRYWRKRAAYFSRRSSAKQYFGRSLHRLKRIKKTRPRLWLSRNSRTQLLLLKRSSTPSGSRFTHPHIRIIKRKGKKKKNIKKNSNFFFEALKYTNVKRIRIHPTLRLQKRMKYSRNYLSKALKTLLKKTLTNKSYNQKYVATPISTHIKRFHRFLNFPPNVQSVNETNYSSSRLQSFSVPLFLVSRFWYSPILIKYYFYHFSNLRHKADTPCTQSVRFFTNILQQQIKAYSFSAMSQKLQQTNTWSYFNTKYTLDKKLLRSVSQMVFRADVTPWTQRCLIHFLENISGRKIAINIGPFVDHILTLDDHARCFLWDNRSSGFKKLLGHRIFTSEAVMIVTASLRLKDPTLLANWIRGMLYRMSFWKYRVLFRYLKFLIQHLFRFNFPDFNFKGFKLRLKGKISVGGNSRSRILFYRVGDTSHSKMSNKVAYDLSYINTFTGILGFKLWFFY